MNRFEYIMVLVSIIVGLGITHILLGVGAILDRMSVPGTAFRPSLAHSSWLGFVFTWMILFWWWEYRFAELQPGWNVSLYFFLVLYGVILFLLAVVLVPRSWDQVVDLDEYLIQRRFSFYSLLFAATVLDVVDSYLKGGWSYVADNGPWVWLFWLITVPVCIVGMRSTLPRHHAAMALTFWIWQIAVGFEALPTLGL